MASRKCLECDGKGKVDVWDDSTKDFVKKKCRSCKGTGKIPIGYSK